jgi:hypothetical protein
MGTFYRRWKGTNHGWDPIDAQITFQLFWNWIKLIQSPGAPFKFNPRWASDEEFQDLVKENWLRYDPS